MTFACQEVLHPANDNELKCPQCGAFFAFRSGKKFCSRACKKLFGDRPENKHKNAPEHECAGCGMLFRRRADSKNAARYCSRKCFGTDLPVVSPENKKYASEQLFVVVTYRKTCVRCERRFTGGNIVSNVCRDCSRDKLAANDNNYRAPRPCHECKTLFAPEYGDYRRKFCSVACSRRAANKQSIVTGRKAANRLARKMLERAATVETVNPIVVFDRDGWRCQLCKVKTPRRLRGTYEPNAPELDHIIPLSCGGEHSYRNTQCACRSCNAEKSNTPLGQLRLFG